MAQEPASNLGEEWEQEEEEGGGGGSCASGWIMRTVGPCNKKKERGEALPSKVKGPSAYAK